MAKTLFHDRQYPGSRRSTFFAAIAGLVVVGLVLTIAGSVLAAGRAGASMTFDSVEAQFYSLLNSDRAQEGLPPLPLDPALVAVARGWSAHMMAVHQRTGDPVIKPDAPTDCERSSLCHRGDLATAVGSVAPGWRAIGENLATGGDIGAMNSGLVASPGHHANIVGAYDRVGIGVVLEGDRIWVTFDFVAAPPPAEPGQAVPVASAGGSPVVPIGARARFNPVAPERVADTRTGGLLTAGDVLPIDLAGHGQVPAGATGVALNLTVTQPQAAGYLAAYPCGVARPTTSSLNYTAGETRANAAYVALAATGTVCIYTSASAHVVVDVSGWFGPSGAGFQPAAPRRLFDSRQSGGSGTSFVINASSIGDASAVTVNVTVADPSGPGFLTAYPCGTTPPEASNVNFVAHQTIANLATVKVAAGQFCLFSSVPTDVIVDVAGAYGAAGSAYTSTAPSRFLDTRDSTGGWTGRLAPMQRVELPIGGRRGVPSGATAAILNLTVTDTAAAGYAVAFPCDQAMPDVSNVNYGQADTVANLVAVRLSSTGSVCLATSARANVVADLAGWFQT